MNEVTDHSFRMTIVLDEEVESCIYMFYKDKFEMDQDVPLEDFVLAHHEEVNFFDNDALVDYLQDVELEGKEDIYGIRKILVDRLGFDEHEFFVVTEITFGFSGCIMQVSGSFSWQ